MISETTKRRIWLLSNILEFDEMRKDEDIDDFIDRVIKKVQKQTLFTEEEIRGFLVMEIKAYAGDNTHREFRRNFTMKAILGTRNAKDKDPDKVQNTIEFYSRYQSNDYIDETGDKFDRYLKKHTDTWITHTKNFADEFIENHSDFSISMKNFFKEINNLHNGFSKVYLGSRHQSNYFPHFMSERIFNKITDMMYPVFKNHLEQQDFSVKLKMKDNRDPLISASIKKTEQVAN